MGDATRRPHENQEKEGEEVSVTQLFPSGAWECADIIDSVCRRVSKVYYFCDKEEAIASFKDYIKEEFNEEIEGC